MFEDLTAAQKREMSHFFWTELHSSAWMQSLSSSDVDATWNIRPDHSSIGAYPAWPPMTAKGLYKIDPSENVANWVKQLARAGNQGPFGQAHFIETIFPREKGGAYKSPDDAPYLNDWCCVSGGLLCRPRDPLHLRRRPDALRRNQTDFASDRFRCPCQADKSALPGEQLHPLWKSCSADLVEPA